MKIIKAAKFGEFKSEGRFDKIQGCFESSAAAICFVSSHYKASYRCRMQAELLERLQVENKVNCVFIEMSDGGPLKGWLSALVERTCAAGAQLLKLSSDFEAGAQRSEIADAVRRAAREKPGSIGARSNGESQAGGGSEYGSVDGMGK